MNLKRFRNYLYNVENILDEFVIVILSVGAIAVAIWTAFYSSQEATMVSFGRDIQPWVTMLALMIIGRELWLMNRKVSHYLDQQGE
jgi:uncharacterized membrane protein